MEAELVFVPTPGIGHLLSIVEFAKRLLHRHHTFSITVLIMKPVYTPSLQYTSLVSDNSRIRFIYLPPIDPPASIHFSDSPEAFTTVLTETYTHHVRAAIADQVLPKSQLPLAGLVLDLFCTPMVDVAKELGVPSYIYLTSGASFLCYITHLPVRHERVGSEFNESDPESVIPGFVNPVPSSVLPALSFNKLGYSAFLNHAEKLKQARGIIVNTYAELEFHAVKSLSSGPVYTVGPVLDLNRQRQNDDGWDKIMKWLDDQPPSSVVYLSFGSMGSFGGAQLREIATGLRRSGVRFLWAIRKPKSGGKFDIPTMYGDGELEEVLPREFLEAAEGMAGLVCGWAPQKEVLAHRAVGGFVSHCGWNSVLESLWFGVPIAAWPMYAEQQLSAFELVTELGLAVEVRVGYRIDGGDVVVAASEVERAVRCVMEGGSEVRKKVKEMSEKSRKAVMEGGSSFASLGRLVDDMLDQIHIGSSTHFLECAV